MKNSIPTTKRSGTDWCLEKIQPPWGDRPSIYDHIAQHFTTDSSDLPKHLQKLPDEAVSADGWVSGGVDGTALRNGDSGYETNRAWEVVRALQRALETTSGIGPLHDLVTRTPREDHRVIGYIDRLLELIATRGLPDESRLGSLATWLVRGAADREVVKLGIALLGICSKGENRDLLTTLGRHEEFTLYVVQALTRSMPDAEAAEDAIWEIAQRVRGWGRVHAVWSLAKTKNPRIQRWLLVEGRENQIENEFTALACARGGDLVGAFRSSKVSPALLEAGLAILNDLWFLDELQSYEHSVEVIESSIRHLNRRLASPGQFHTVSSLRSLVDSKDSFAPKGSPWRAWTRERRDQLVEECDRLLSRSGHKAMILEVLRSADGTEFRSACAAARISGVDSWPALFERLQEGGHCWAELAWEELAKTTDPERFERVVALALERLSLGDGEDDADFPFRVLLAQVRYHPGLGWPLIRAALERSDSRNRFDALLALDGWGRERWESDGECILQRALEEETDPTLREWIEIVRSGGRMPGRLYDAVTEGLEEVRAELRCGGDLHDRRGSFNGGTALMVACRQFHATTLEVVALLLDEGAEIDAVDEEGRTALMRASGGHSDLDTIKLLLDRGADLHTRDHSGCSALLHAARHWWDPEAVELLLDRGAEIEDRDSDGRTPLMIAAQHSKNPGEVASLLDRGADLEARDSIGVTPLMLAAREAKTPEVVALLLDRGAEIEARASEGWTPLMFAAVGWKSVEHVRLLLDRGAEIEARSEAGVTPLGAAANDAHNPEILTLLLDRGAELEARSDKGWTPLMQAASGTGSNSVDLVALLLDRGAEVSACTETGLTPLCLAARSTQSPACLALLLEAGADLEGAVDTGQTPLFFAAGCSDAPEVVALLLDGGAEINARDTGRRSPLMWAVSRPVTPDFISLLLERGADVDAQDSLGASPLMIAAGKTLTPQVISLLLNFGADPMIEDGAGKKAIDYAEENPALEDSDALRELRRRS